MHTDTHQFFPLSFDRRHVCVCVCTRWTDRLRQPDADSVILAQVATFRWTIRLLDSMTNF